MLFLGLFLDKEKRNKTSHCIIWHYIPVYADDHPEVIKLFRSWKIPLMDQYSRNSPLEVDEQQLLGQHRQTLRCMEFLGTSRVLLASCPELSQPTSTEQVAYEVHLIPNLSISAKPQRDVIFQNPNGTDVLTARPLLHSYLAENR